MLLDIIERLHDEFDFILASQSPRRLQLCHQLGLRVTVLPSNFPENLPHNEYSPQEYAQQTCYHKAVDVYQRIIDNAKRPFIIISADSIVVCGDRILEKAQDENVAAAMIQELSGRQHSVITAVTLMRSPFPPSKLPLFDLWSETTRVTFADLSPAIITAYIATGAWREKAGAYGVQDVAAQFVSSLDGDYYNVMGLPIFALAQHIRTFATTTTVTDQNKHEWTEAQCYQCGHKTDIPSTACSTQCPQCNNNVTSET